MRVNLPNMELLKTFVCAISSPTLWDVEVVLLLTGLQWISWVPLQDGPLAPSQQTGILKLYCLCLKEIKTTVGRPLFEHQLIKTSIIQMYSSNVLGKNQYLGSSLNNF